MKNLILLFSMCLMAKFSFAKTIHPSIEDDLDFKMESEYKESDRGVAALEEVEKPEVKSENKENSQEQRDVASDEDVFESTNENGIRYWKY